MVPSELCVEKNFREIVAVNCMERISFLRGAFRLAFFLFFFLAAAGSDAEAQSPSVAKHSITEVRRFAVIVGANQGGQGRAVLRYAQQDAATLEHVFGGIGGVQLPDRTVLRQPPLQALEKAFSELSQRVQQQRALPGNRSKRFELLFYYSGHSDEQGLLIGDKKISYKELKRWISGVPTDVHVAILDSCASGAFTRLKGGAHRKPFLFANSGNVKGHAFIASSSADEASQESDRIAGSFFTHYLVSGLRGAADVDGDGLVTINEAFLFARNETLSRTQSTQAGAQHPAYELKLAGTGDLVLTDLRHARSSVELGADLRGRVFVRNRDKRLIAELFKGKGKVRLALETGHYQVAIDDGQQLREAKLDLARDQQLALSGKDFKLQEREKIAGIRGGYASAPAVPRAVETRAPAPSSGMGEPGYAPFHAALSPGIGYPTFKPSQERNAHFSVSLFHAKLTRLRGIALGMGLVSTVIETRGWQSGFIGNASRGHARGLQSSFVFNAGMGTNHGAQLTFGFNLARRFDGIQAALGVNASQSVNGAQAAVGMNMAQKVNGAQLAVGLNMARELRGAQISAINLAGKVRGLQLGIINVADEADVSIGLLPITRGGVHAEVFASDLAAFNFALRFDAKYNFSFVTVGMHPFERGQLWMVGLGTGVKIPLSTRFHLAPDVAVRWGIGGDLGFLERHLRQSMTIASLRVLLNLRLADRLTLFGGPAWHIRFATEKTLASLRGRPGFQLPSFALNSDSTVRSWFGFAAGLRF